MQLHRESCPRFFVVENSARNITSDSSLQLGRGYLTEFIIWILRFKIWFLMLFSNVLFCLQLDQESVELSYKYVTMLSYISWTLKLNFAAMNSFQTWKKEKIVTSRFWTFFHQQIFVFVIIFSVFPYLIELRLEAIWSFAINCKALKFWS